MPREIIEVRVEKSDKDSLFSNFVAKIGSGMIVNPNSDIRVLATSLSLKLKEIGDRDDCGFMLIDATSKRRWLYKVYSHASLGLEEDGLYVIPQQELPKRWTINKRFYHWFTGRGRP